MYTIEQSLIPDLPRTPFRNGIGAYEGVVNHSTDDTEATADDITNFEKNHWSSAFVHFVVDWTKIKQLAPTDYMAYGAGHVANLRYLHVELCETKDTGKFKESYARYVWLVAELLRRKSLGVTEGRTVVSHDWVTKNLGNTTHSDPIEYLASHGVSWTQHVKNVGDMYNSFFERPAPPVAQLTKDVTRPAVTTPDTYTVVSGDTLWQLSEKFKLSVAALKMMNGLSSDLLKVGQVLHLKPAVAPKKVNKIQIVGVSSAAFICDKPSADSNNIGTIALGQTIEINGSVPGWWEVKYNGRLGYVNEKFGRLV